uniref:Uncharacterized protein n=1 Tax=Salmo trutta TaxID=8032 RepID=A0A673ZEE6_SALTR
SWLVCRIRQVSVCGDMCHVDGVQNTAGQCVWRYVSCGWSAEYGRSVCVEICVMWMECRIRQVSVCGDMCHVDGVQNTAGQCVWRYVSCGWSAEYGRSVCVEICVMWMECRIRQVSQCVWRYMPCGWSAEYGRSVCVEICAMWMECRIRQVSQCVWRYVPCGRSAEYGRSVCVEICAMWMECRIRQVSVCGDMCHVDACVSVESVCQCVCVAPSLCGVVTSG